MRLGKKKKKFPDLVSGFQATSVASTGIVRKKIEKTVEEIKEMKKILQSKANPMRKILQKKEKERKRKEYFQWVDGTDKTNVNREQTITRPNKQQSLTFSKQ